MSWLLPFCRVVEPHLQVEDLVPKGGGRPSQAGETASLARLCIFKPVSDQGLRDQPTYDRNGVTSPIARFRHPCDDGTGAMPYAITDVGRSVGPFKLMGARPSQWTF